MWKLSPTGRWLWRIALTLLLAGIAGPILTASRHITLHDEPTIISVASAELHGQPLYHAVQSGERYALLYGPIEYWVYWPPMLAHITDLRFFQLWVLLPLALAGILVVSIARRAVNPLGSALALLPYAVTVLLHALNEWAMKGDAWILLFFSVEIQAAIALPASLSIVVVALCGALLINIKVTTLFLAFVPIVLLGNRFGVKKAIQATALTILFTVLPFFMPGVSAVNYLFWLRAAGRHGVSLRFAFTNTELVLFMGLPVMTLLLFLLHDDRKRMMIALRKRSFLVASSLVACLTAIIAGAKVGAGPWHCAPLAPLFVYFTVQLWRRLPDRARAGTLQPVAQAMLASIVLTQCLVGVLALRVDVMQRWKGLPLFHSPAGPLIAQDLADIVRDHKGDQIQMGYGGMASYETTFQRPLLVFLGNRYSIDADTLNETEFAGLPLPQSTLDELRACRSQIFLIPKGDRPFSMKSLYYLGGAAAPRDLFPVAFREEFLRDYRKTSSSRYFDLWSCGA